mgnify:CR=1
MVNSKLKRNRVELETKTIIFFIFLSGRDNILIFKLSQGQVFFHRKKMLCTLALNYKN